MKRARGIGACAHSPKYESKKVKQMTQILRLGLAAFLFAMTSPALLAAPANAGIQGRAALYVSNGSPVQVGPGLWASAGDLMLPVASSFSVLSARSGHKIGSFSADASGAFTI